MQTLIASLRGATLAVPLTLAACAASPVAANDLPDPRGIYERATAAYAGHELPPGRASVVDGDTLDVGGVRVRLKGVDAPERGTVAGDAAAWRLRRLLRGNTVHCAITGERTYGREVGVCGLTPGGEDAARPADLAGILITEGRAARCARYDPAGVYIGAQRAAQAYVEPGGFC